MMPRTASALLLAWAGFSMAASEAPVPTAYGKGSDVYTTSGGLSLSGDLLGVVWPAGAAKPARWLALADVADVSRPKLLGRLELDGFPQDVVLQGGYAFVVNGLDLLVINIADPRAPALATKLAVAQNPMEGPQGIDIVGKTAYLACRRGGVKAVDIGDPLKPRFAAALALPGFVRDVVAAGDCLYAACDTCGVQVIGLHADGTLRDLGRVPAPDGAVGRIRVADDIAFLAAGNVAVASISLKKPAHPSWLGATSDRHIYSAFFGTYCHDLAWSRSPGVDGAAGRLHVFTADGETGMLVYDVTQPGAPRYLAALNDDPQAGKVNTVTAIVLKGTHAILLDDAFGIYVADVSEPTRPRLVGPGLALGP